MAGTKALRGATSATARERAFELAVLSHNAAHIANGGPGRQASRQAQETAPDFSEAAHPHRRGCDNLSKAAEKVAPGVTPCRTVVFALLCAAVLFGASFGSSAAAKEAGLITNSAGSALDQLLAVVVPSILQFDSKASWTNARSVAKRVRLSEGVNIVHLNQEKDQVFLVRDPDDFALCHVALSNNIMHECRVRPEMATERYVKTWLIRNGVTNHERRPNLRDRAMRRAGISKHGRDGNSLAHLGPLEFSLLSGEIGALSDMQGVASYFGTLFGSVGGCLSGVQRSAQEHDLNAQGDKLKETDEHQQSGKPRDPIISIGEPPLYFQVLVGAGVPVGCLALIWFTAGPRTRRLSIALLWCGSLVVLADYSWIGFGTPFAFWDAGVCVRGDTAEQQQRQ